MVMSVAEVAKRWIGTYMNTDPDPNPEELFAPRVIARHNTDDKVIDMSGSEYARYLIDRRAKIRELMPDFKVEDFTQHIAESAFIYVLTSTGTLPDGTRVRIPACVVWDIEDGRIANITTIGDKSHREAMDRSL